MRSSLNRSPISICITWLLGLFAGLALTLAAAGIYGVTAYAVAPTVALQYE